ncbi:MAG: class I SAM-dependent methyltransferase [Rhodospirillaceae bacterium]
MKSLVDIAAASDNEIDKYLHYFPVYERYLSQFVGKSITVLEIGVNHGGSLLMWREYFGENAKIIGIDVNPMCEAFATDQIDVRIGGQEDQEFLQSIIDEFGTPDVVIDDGSHVMDHVNASFDFLYSKVSPNGVYIIEDLHTAYWDDAGGGLKKAGTFIERCKDMVDELNAFHTRKALHPTEFTKSTRSISFYDSMVVFEKAPRGDMVRITTGSTAEEKSDEVGVSINDGEDVQLYVNRIALAIRRGGLNISDVLTLSESFRVFRPDISSFFLNDWVICTNSSLKYLAYYKLGQYQLLMNDRVGAEKSFRASLREKPDFKYARQALEAELAGPEIAGR